MGGCSEGLGAFKSFFELSYVIILGLQSGSSIIDEFKSMVGYTVR